LIYFFDIDTSNVDYIWYNAKFNHAVPIEETE